MLLKSKEQSGVRIKQSFSGRFHILFSQKWQILLQLQKDFNKSIPHAFQAWSSEDYWRGVRQPNERSI